MTLPPEEPTWPEHERRRSGADLAAALQEVRQVQEAATTLASAVVKTRTDLRDSETRSNRQIRWIVGTGAALYVFLVLFALILVANLKGDLRLLIEDGHNTLECVVALPEPERQTTKALNECRQAAEVDR